MDISHTKQTEAAPESGAPNRSLPGHLADLTDQTIELFRKELRLAKVEMNEKFDQVKQGIGGLAAGSMILAGGLLTLLAAAVFGIGLFMPYWLSALIVGGVVTLIGGVVLGKGRQDVRPEKLEPERIIEELKRDKQLIQEHAS
jgi:VIT1/CCC1 family predicted Fe2+/Mn2+ transporter